MVKRMVLMELIYAVIIGIIFGFVLKSFWLGMLAAFIIGACMIAIMLFILKRQERKASRG
ncbi:hypothetical protein [Gracilibacillus alcaliphilus]|uniref:hypothetical protein n=1 Tax=Gracilibacillus alcaliphilus TaxID=1401441 RepID=UPI001959EF3E|nr:hypothetical protein [Gracilibacillus alcaliphilus]MBM7678869.1 putative membrane protein AbrB (regulator of aidB expression) [Gracilibacillus alcaliphilus]